MTPLPGRQPVADLIRAATLIAAVPTFIFGTTGDALRFLLVGVLLWDSCEWTYEQIAPNSMVVGYTDTLADLAAGLDGSAVAAAVLVAVWRRS